MTDAFTTRYYGVSNVLISDVGIFPAFNPEKTKKFPKGKQYSAIWDTGATGSVITQKVVAECGLKQTSVTQVHTAGGVISDCPVYLVNIMLPNNTGVPGVRVTEAESIGGNADVLIGMDIITLGDLAVTTYNGKTMFSFRSPSEKEIDFVKEIESKKGKTNLASAIHDVLKK